MFISKKTKAQIRARRKKNPALTKEKRNNNSSNSTNQTKPNIDTERHIFIEIPKGLSGKDLRKFRKDERRKFRIANKDHNNDDASSSSSFSKELHFINEGEEHTIPEKNQQQPSTTENDTSSSTNQSQSQSSSSSSQPTPPTPNNNHKKRKRTHTFPRINDLLAEAREAELASQKRSKQETYENSISPEEKAKYVALDCEMVGIGRDGKQSALARVSITDWSGSTLLDTFVTVPDKVTDFRTYVSGVRARDIRSGSDAMDLTACRKLVGEMLRNKVLVGHALRNDFAALMLTHPKRDVRDTARFAPFMRVSGRGGGKLRPRRLRDLAKEFLDLEIQKDGEEHSSVDDARATMELYKVMRVRWEKEVEAALVEKEKRRSGKKSK